ASVAALPRARTGQPLSRAGVLTALCGPRVSRIPPAAGGSHGKIGASPRCIPSFLLPMLAKRIIPCLDVTGGPVVKGVNFVELRDAGDPVEIAARYNDQGADELTFLDITATSDDRGL